MEPSIRCRVGPSGVFPVIQKEQVVPLDNLQRPNVEWEQRNPRCGSSVPTAGKQQLTVAEERLSAKVQAFRNKKEIIKAQYSAAQAQVRIGAALGGVSEEMGDVSLAVERAENKTEQLRARAGAIDELAEAGVLEDFTGRQDDLGRELAQLTASQNVEDELAALRAGPSGGDKKALSGGPQ